MEGTDPDPVASSGEFGSGDGTMPFVAIGVSVVVLVSIVLSVVVVVVVRKSGLLVICSNPGNLSWETAEFPSTDEDILELMKWNGATLVLTSTKIIIIGNV